MAEPKETQSTERKLHKDWFDKSAAKAMADQISAVHKSFDCTAFRRSATRNIQSLEFNDRVKQFADALHQNLPAAYPKAISILIKSLPEVPVDAESVTDGWLQWPLGQFIADHGTEHLNESLDAMTELTQRFSSEFAVRPFIERYPVETLKYLNDLTGHPSEHVRRWCSEGCRTRLPWGVKLNKLIENPAPVWRILNQLIDDDSVYVRKSVANNINDLSKDHPQQVLKKCSQWKKKSRPKRDWIIKQGLRTLIKQGDSKALELTGFGAPERLHATILLSPKKIKVGESVKMQARVENRAKKSQSLMLDYVVHYVRKNKVTNEKVFKWKTIDIAAGEAITLVKNHPMKTTTVRALYNGRHKVEIQINGHRFDAAEFLLA